MCWPGEKAYSVLNVPIQVLGQLSLPYDGRGTNGIFVFYPCNVVISSFSTCNIFNIKIVNRPKLQRNYLAWPNSSNYAYTSFFPFKKIKWVPSVALLLWNNTLQYHKVLCPSLTDISYNKRNRMSIWSARRIGSCLDFKINVGSKFSLDRVCCYQDRVIGGLPHFVSRMPQESSKKYEEEIKNKLQDIRQRQTPPSSRRVIILFAGHFVFFFLLRLGMWFDDRGRNDIWRSLFAIGVAQLLVCYVLFALTWYPFTWSWPL